MSSYCLVLMAIGYLQYLGLLPNLQSGVPFAIPDDSSKPTGETTWVSWNREQGIKAKVGFSRLPPNTWTPKSLDLSLSQVIRGFFEHFSRAGDFRHKERLVSILNGGILERSEPQGKDADDVRLLRSSLADQGFSLPEMAQVLKTRAADKLENERYMGKGNKGTQPRFWSERTLVVQDPFLWQKVGPETACNSPQLTRQNCAASMHRSGVDRWLDTVDATARILKNRGADATLRDILEPGLGGMIDMPNRGGAGPGSNRGSRRARGSRGSRGLGGRGR